MRNIGLVCPFKKKIITTHFEHHARKFVYKKNNLFDIGSPSEAGSALNIAALK